MDEPFEEKILNRVIVSDSLRISRVPVKTKEEFIKLAHEEFCDDYGMTLKWLLDGIPSQDTTLLLGEINALAERLAALEELLSLKAPAMPGTETEQADTGVRRMLDGSTRRVKPNGK